MNKKILILGSCGSIGSNIIRSLIYKKEPYMIASIDRVNSSLSSVYWNKNHNFNIGDILDAHCLDVVFEYERPDIVLFAAGLNNTKFSFENPSLVLNNNITGMQNVINSCIKHKVQKLIYLSSASVYGEQKFDHDKSFTETDLLNPSTPYAISKKTAEELIISSNKNYGLNYNILRLSNCYGPRQNSNFLIPKIVKSIINKNQIDIYGSGMQLREWTHIFDASAAIINILNNGKLNEIYNISSNQEFTNLEVVQKICNHFKTGHELIKNIEDVKGNIYRKSINSSKIRELGSNFPNTFNDSIGDVADWFQLNQFILK